MFFDEMQGANRVDIENIKEKIIEVLGWFKTK